MMGYISVSHMSYKNIVFEHSQDGIAIITVNRPDKLNALDRDTMGELDSAFLLVRNEPNLRALIVTGAGEKAFVAGADIQELAAIGSLAAADFSAAGQRIFRRLEQMRKPSVAAINGFALGAGLELAMACTLRVAVGTAKLALPELKLGLVPGYGGTQRLPRLVGRGKALELLLTGEKIGAEEACRLGLVNRVLPADKLLEGARELLSAILGNSPVAVGLAMDAVDMAFCGGLEEGLRFESAAFGIAAGTSDKQEGIRAFLEKRPPVFTGK